MANIPFLNNAYFAAKVGIGTDSPERLLSLYSNNAETTPRLLIEQDGTGDAVMAFSLTGGQGWSMGIDNSGSDSFMIHNSAGGVDSSSQFTINTNGKVGIGTTSPSTKLDVNGEIKSDGYRIDLSGGTERVITSTGTDSIQFGDAGVNEFKFKNTAGTPMIITSSGNVGIGTTSPASKLTISAPVGNFANGANAISLNYGGGASPGDVGGGIVFSQKWWSTSAGQQVTGGIFGIKNAGNGTYGGGLAFYTQPSSAANMAQRMVIDTGGNVGIGTTSPTVNLQVYDASSSQIKITNGLATPVDLQLFASSSSYAGIGTASDHKLAIRTNGTDKVTVLSNGNVGIGTTNPEKKLHVEGDVRIKSAFPRLYLTDTDSNSDYSIINNNGKFSIYDDTNTDYRMVINSSGNVGIGTTSPASKLHVVGTDGTYQTRIGHSTQSLYLTVDGANVDYKSSGSSAGSHSFSTGNTERMRIASNGNVGIGTTSPGGNLHVVGNAGSSGQIYLSDRDNGTGTGDALLINKSGTSAFIYNRDSGDLRLGSNDQSSMVSIKSTGNVGIGTTNPSEKLGVFGNIRLENGAQRNIIGPVNENLGIFANPNGSDEGILFSTDNGATTEMIILNGGNVGIGTTSPVQKLHINNSTASSVSYAKFSNAQTGATTADGFDIGVNTGAEAVIWQRENTNLLFATNNSEKMRITSSGILMVGGTTGGYAGTKIHVGNFSDTQNGINILSSTTGYGYVLFGDGTGADTYRGQIAYSHGDDSMVFNTNGSEKLRIVSGGGISFAGATNFGSAGQVLKSNGSASPAWVDASTVIGGPYLPLAGGTMTGDLKLNDAVQLKLGTGNDLRIYHSGTNSNIENNSGTLQIIQNLDDGDIVFKSDNGSGGTATYLTLDGSTTHAYFSNPGNVGIGTTSPDANLEVADSIPILRITGTRNASWTIGQTMASLEYFSEDASGSSANSVRASINLVNETSVYGSTTGLSFSTKGDVAGSPIEAMRIDSSGNVGIGTTSPDAKLHINTGATYEVGSLSGSMLIEPTGVAFNGYGAGIVLGAGRGGRASGGAAIASVLDSTSDVDRSGLSFFYHNSTFTDPRTEGMRLDADGNVGIGTTSPSAPLHINGGANSEVLKVEATSDPFMRFVENGTNVGFLQFTGGTAYLANMANGDFRFRTNNTDQMILTNQGRLGIGTTSPVYKLDANGGVRAGGVITYSKPYSNLNTTGQAVAGLTSSSNGNSTGFTFTCFGDTGGYQKIVYSCYNDMGTWRTKKVINEGTNNFDVEASADGSTITFTFKSTSGTKYYTPRVTIEATGHSINSTYA